MKIMSRKKQDEILKRVAACQIICNKYIKDIEAMERMTENLADISIIVDGSSGASKVQNTIRKY